LVSYTMSPPALVKWKTFGKGDTDNDYGWEPKIDDKIDTSQGGGKSQGLMSSAREALKVLDGKFHEWKVEGKA